MSKAAVTDMTIAGAAREIRRGDLSPVELTQMVLARIAATEPAIHAYVVVQAEEALAAARQAEAELRAGNDRGPLHGIPVAVKDIIDVQGVPTRCGSAFREDVEPARRDAPVVARLRAAGAVIVGKTVTHEFAAGIVSPPARNPWDPMRIPGGSSGGSGASVVAGSSFAALGSDTAGSIRVPAAFNGAVGLKPTYEAVSREGVFPLSWSLDTIGPLARTVTDAELVFQAIRDDHAATHAQDPDGIRGARLGVPGFWFYDRLHADVRAAVEEAISTLAGLGAEIVDVAWPEASAAAAAGFVNCRHEMASIHERRLRTAPELFNPVLRTRLEAFTLAPARDYLRARRARTVLRRTVADLYRQHRLDALITPTLPTTATLAGAPNALHEDGEEPIQVAFTRFTMPFNATGQPALSLPCGFDRDGLPIGLQIVGRRYEEGRICAIGREYQEATEHHRRRPAL